MKILAFIVIAISLVVGFIGALTAYVPRLEDSNELSGLHLNAPAGVRTDLYDVETHHPSPLAEPGSELTPELVAQLRAAGEERVRVREFALGRWTGLWLFAAGCTGLLVSGLFLRQQSKHELLSGAAGGTAGGPADPTETLAAMRREVAELLLLVGALPESSAGAFRALPEELNVNRLIMDRVGQIQVTLMPAFIDARPRLVAVFGMAGYARLMDSYAAAERSLNRAWSAAADNDEMEAIASLERALALLDESAKRLPAASPVQAITA